MKQHKRLRLVSIVCLAALLVSCLPGAYAYGVSSAWAREELDAMAALDLIPALLEERGDLRENITRLEMCALAVQAYERYTGEELSLPDETPFPDTNDPIAAKSYAAGFALGYEDGTFRPDRLLTRQEFFVFVSRFLQAAGLDPAEHGEDLAGFVDAGTVSAWALDATWQVVDLGVVQGSGGKLDPLGHTTCEQALAMFYRAYINLMGESQATQASVENKYPNLSPWAKEELEAMDQLGLIPEVLLGRDMATPITRGEMCYVAMEAYLSLYPNPIFRVEESPFTDADDPVITKAYYLGLISGFPDGTFRPDIPITREQFFKITVNFLSVCGYPYEDSPSTSLDHFTDAGELSSYALPCARLLVELGIVKGPLRTSSTSWRKFARWSVPPGLPLPSPWELDGTASALKRAIILLRSALRWPCPGAGIRRSSRTGIISPSTAAAPRKRTTALRSAPGLRPIPCPSSSPRAARYL